MEGRCNRRDYVGSKNKDPGVKFADCAEEGFDGDNCGKNFEVKNVRPVIHWNCFNGAGGVGCVRDYYYAREVETMRMCAGERVGRGGDVTVEFFDCGLSTFSLLKKLD